MTPRLIRTCALSVAPLLVSGLLVLSGPADAAPALTVTLGGGADFDQSSGCTITATTDPPDKPVPGNGKAVATSFSEAASISKTGDPTDVSTVTASGSATATVHAITAAAGGSVVLSGHTAASVTAPATTACDAEAEPGVGVSVEATLPAPMWLTVSYAGTSGATIASLGSTSMSGVASISEMLGKGSGSTTVFLPAGSYQASLVIESGAEAGGLGSGLTPTASGSVKAVFTPVGAASAVSGKGTKYVGLGTRSCATNVVGASVSKTARAKAKKVVFTVNGHAKLTLSGKKLKKAKSVTLGGIAATSAAKVVATITPKKGKKVTVSRSYLACR